MLTIDRGLITFRCPIQNQVKTIDFLWQLNNFILIFCQFSIDLAKLFKSSFKLFVFLLETYNLLIQDSYLTLVLIYNSHLSITYLLS